MVTDVSEERDASIFRVEYLRLRNARCQCLGVMKVILSLLKKSLSLNAWQWRKTDVTHSNFTFVHSALESVPEVEPAFITSYRCNCSFVILIYTLLLFFATQLALNRLHLLLVVLHARSTLVRSRHTSSSSFNFARPAPRGRDGKELIQCPTHGCDGMGHVSGNYATHRRQATLQLFCTLTWWWSVPCPVVGLISVFG